MITIKEIAEKTGVSPATVSRVLNHDGTLSVSDKTREKILRYAKEHGYKTVNERKGRVTISYSQPGNRRIGVALMHNTEELLKNLYHMTLKQMVDEVCFEHGLATVTVSRDGSGVFNTVDGGSLDGIIAIGNFTREEVENFTHFTENIVFIDSVPDPIKYYSIECNHSLAIRLLLKHCREKDVKRVLFCGKQTAFLEYKDVGPDPRFYFFRAMLLSFFTYDASLNVIPSENGDCYKETMEYFKDKRKTELPDVILVSNDIYVTSLMKALRELKIKVPKDIGVITINNTENSISCDPPLTSVELFPKEQAISALMCLQSMWYGMDKPKRIMVPCTLVDRGSL